MSDERTEGRLERLNLAIAKAKAQKRKRSITAKAKKALEKRIAAYEDEKALIEAAGEE